MVLRILPLARAISLLLLLIFTYTLPATALDDVVDLGYVKYRGIASGRGVKAWLGVRYAAPPVGELRFAAPAEPAAVAEVVDAGKYGPICIETDTTYAASVKAGSSEDCLFANIYAPVNATNLPVYVFIQGGGFNKNSDANLNGTGLVQASGNNIVVVNFNYRVGPYGFLASDEVLKGGSVNNGLKDQRQLLKWVQKHISKFGGNPNQVVIGGASAGAASVTLHLTAYGGRNDNLFHGAAAESQSFASMLTVSEAQYIYDALVARTNCTGAASTLACLRAAPIATLQDVNTNIPLPGAQAAPLYLYSPTIDSDLVKDYTYALYARGAVIPVPAIYGDDTDEGTSFVPKKTATQEAGDRFLRNQFPALTTADLDFVHTNYPPPATAYPDAGIYWTNTAQAYGEIRYICPGINISTVHGAVNKGKIWNYRWNVIDPTDAASGRGVKHTVEVAAIWGHINPATGEPVPNGGPASYVTTNKEIIPVVQGYWTSFVRALDPNTHRASGTPSWEEWSKAEKRLRFETGKTEMEAVTEAQRTRCEYWARNAVRLKQ